MGAFFVQHSNGAGGDGWLTKSHLDTADWVQDAARAQLQRRVQKRKDGYYVRGPAAEWRRKLSQSYDAGQAWIVISLIGGRGGSYAPELALCTEC